MTTTSEPSTPHAQRIEELGRIIMAYSEVTERLQHSHDDLKNKVHALQQELGEKNRELERGNRLAALGEMAAGLAHEIRNPLGGIQLYASLLAQDVADRPDSLKTVGKIITGVKRLELLVSQVLHFTREIVPHPSDVDVAEVVREAVEIALNRAMQTGVQLELNISGPLHYQVDSHLITQAVLNLVLNAIDAASGREGACVWVHLSSTESSGLSLVIEDNGAGIPAEILDRISNPFFTTKDDGTGLGLSIVHRIVEAHGGVITASNRSDGGARFEIRL